MDISVQELKEKLDRGDAFLFLDVREPHEAEEFSLGAQLVPLGSLSEQIRSLSDNKNDEVVVLCRSGARSQMAQEMLRGHGFSRVRNVTGGVLAWQRAFGK